MIFKFVNGTKKVKEVTARHVQSVEPKKEPHSNVTPALNGYALKHLKHIREALLSEEGLVAEDDLETFQEQIGRSINDKMIAALKKYAKMAQEKGE